MRQQCGRATWNITRPALKLRGAGSTGREPSSEGSRCIVIVIIVGIFIITITIIAIITIIITVTIIIVIVHHHYHPLS